MGKQEAGEFKNSLRQGTPAENDSDFIDDYTGYKKIEMTIPPKDKQKLQVYTSSEAVNKESKKKGNE